MDATLSLALMMKAKIVFERDSNFLCFPLTPISYVPGDLSFLVDATPSAIDLTNLSAFSTLVNMIPDNIMWPPSQVNYLWDAYADVLHNADLAQSTRTADEEHNYEAAKAILYTTNSDQTRTPSSALQAYDLCRDSYIVAEQNYATAKNTAETTTDPTVKSQWAMQAPLLLQAIDDSRSVWNEKGCKSQIEEALGMAERLGAKSPELEWQQWTAEFEPSTNALTDATGQPFYPSVPSPINVFEQGAVWQQFTLVGDEADALIKQAPDDLRSRLAPKSLDIALEKLSFEYTSVALKRAWFDPRIFDQRFWRFADNHVISDGQSLTKGNCPAYVLALVFARNVQIQLAANSVRNVPVLSHFQEGNGLNLGFVALRPTVAPAPAHATHPGTITPLTLAASSHAVTPIAAARSSATSAHALRPMIRPMVATSSTAASAEHVTTPSTLAFNRAYATIVQARLVERSMPAAQSPPATGSSPAPPSSVADSSTMYVLGFLCRHVPQTPNPDSSLTWK